MRIIAKSTLQTFWRRHPDAEWPLLAWYREVEKEDWPCEGKSEIPEREFRKG
jgi:mRNA interferase HigB